MSLSGPIFQEQTVLLGPGEPIFRTNISVTDPLNYLTNVFSDSTSSYIIHLHVLGSENILMK